MNIGHVARLLSGFVLFFTLALLVPLTMSMTEESDMATTIPFLGSIGVGLAMAFGLWALGRTSKGDFFRKDGLVTVGLAWFVAGALAAVPFLWSGAIPSFVDAWFECVSGLTTTGATVLGTANKDIESLPGSLLLWRAMLQWMGGIGIVLAFIVLLPSVGVHGSRLLSSEQIGMAGGPEQPRMATQARRLFYLYLGLSSICALAYYLAGLSGFDAICHAMTTIATAGFSNNNVSIGGYQNLAVEIVAITFMFLAGCNFLLMLGVLPQRSQTVRVTPLLVVEFLLYFGITVLVALGISLSLWHWGQPMLDPSTNITHEYANFGRCLRDGFFQAVSILTSTGYANADFQNWPKPALYLLFLCMFIGGCTGSTAGGFKVLRVLVCFKLAAYTLRQFIQPRTVEKIRIRSNLIPNKAISSVLGLLLIWIGTVAAGAFILDLDPRLDFLSALTASVSMMSCTGPCFGQVVDVGDGSFDLVGEVNLGPYGGYGELHAGSKLFMTVQMVLGRLEILAPLALFAPRFWRK